jgi:hypothetical protein
MTLSALGIFSAAGAGGGVSLSDYELINTQILSSTQSSITFDVSSLASTYKHLQLRTVTRSTGGGNAFMTFNSDTATNYSWHLLYGNGSSALVASGANSSSMLVTATVPTTANVFTSNVIDILDFASTTKNKTVRSLGGSPATTEIVFFSGAWRNTAAVTSVTMGLTSFVSGSRFSLYGIKG